MELCDVCQKKFDEQDGRLMVKDMCEECRYDSLEIIVDEDETEGGDFEFCEKCQKKFEDQFGELRVLDMCSVCKVKILKGLLNE